MIYFVKLLFWKLNRPIMSRSDLPSRGKGDFSGVYS